MKTIAVIRNDYETKFGVPRQSGLVTAAMSRIVFEPEYRNADALRGLEDFSHLWLIWEFSEAKRDGWSPTVRPPRLGGNTRMGVFATRSPFRPNPIGLSCVKIERIELHTEDGPVIFVSGADLMNGTPIFDVKPYVTYADSRPEARSGFVDEQQWEPLQVVLPEEVCASFSQEEREALRSVLAQDPRPRYHDDNTRVYGMTFAGHDVHFRVSGSVLTVVSIN